MNFIQATVASYALMVSTTASATTLTVPAGRVPSNLLRFPMYIDLSDMPMAFWRSVSPDGGNIRVTTAADAEVPIDIVRIDPVTRTGEMFARVNITAAANTVFKVKTSPGLVAPAKTDNSGQFAVWEDYRCMYAFNSLEDRAGKSGPVLIEGDTTTFNYTTVAKSPLVNVHQGVTYDGTHYYTIDTTFVQKRDAAWNILATLNLGSLSIPGINHFGDGCMWNGLLVVTVEKYTNNPYNNQHLVFVNPATMTVEYTRDVSAGLHELSGITYHPGQDCFYCTEFPSTGNSRLHRYTTDGVYLGPWAHEGAVTLKQAVSYRGGKFFVTGSPGNQPTIHSIDENTGKLTLEWTGNVGAAIEGLECLPSGDILVLFDGSGNGVSNVFTFSPTPTEAKVAGWLNLDGRGNGRAFTSRNTNWTIGASLIPAAITAFNQTILSLSEATEDNASRATLVQRLLGNYGIWSSSNGWLDAPPSPAPAVGQRVRLHQTQSGTTSRKLYLNGALGASQSSVVARPSTAAEFMYIGAEDTSYAERLTGAVNYVYMRYAEMPASFIKAEYDSWEAGGFYTVGA